MTNLYVLDGKEPVIEPDPLTWEYWMGNTDRRVNCTEISADVTVSTVFLGSDHQYGDGPPLLFETLVFGGQHDGDMWRYSAWDEAEQGHGEMVTLLRAEL